MLVLTRHRAETAPVAELLAQAEAALEVLAQRPGFVRGWAARAADDADLVLLATEWINVGSWRRALSPVDVRVAVLPFLGSALDEATAFIVHGSAGDAVNDGDAGLAQ